MKYSLETTIFKCFLLSVIAFASGGCRHDPDISTAPQIGFDEVKSIVSGKCSSCHRDGGESFLMDSTRIMSYIEPFDPFNSKLFEVVTNTFSENFMPPLPNAPLDKDQRTKLYLWILQGANPKSISILDNQ